MTTQQELRRRNRQAAQQALEAQGIPAKVKHARLNKFLATLDPAPTTTQSRILEKRLQAFLDDAGYWTTVVVNEGLARFYFFNEAERPELTT